MNCDLLIINGLIKTPANPNPDPGQLGYLAILDHLITDVGQMSELPGSVEAINTIDAEGGLVIPGLINCHTHAAMTLFRGLADDLPLMSWLQEHIFPAEAKFVDSEMVYLCSKLAAAEMILSGTTSVADGYFLEDEAIRAFKETGLRAVAAQGVIDFPAPGVPDPAENIAAAARFLERWKDDDLIVPAVFCHSPYTCSEKTIAEAKQLARRTGSHFFIHVAETEFERTESLNTQNLSPVGYLESLGVLDKNTVLVHCVWVDDDDIRIIKDSGAGVVCCPQSNMKLAAGMAPVEKFSEVDVPLGIGTDGCASNNKLDMFREMTFAAKMAKAKRFDPTILPAGIVYRMATRGGAAVLGLQDDIGELTVGRKADLVILDLNKPHLTPMYNADSLMIYAASGADVRTSIINGNLVMDNYRLLTIDLQATLSAVKKLASRIRKTF